MTITALLSGLALALLVALAVELAEVSSRLRTVQLRYRDRLAEPSRSGVYDRLGGVALAVVVIWFFALPWVSQAQNPAAALALFLAMFVVGLALLSRLRVASVRYPLATFGPLTVVAAATALT